MTNIPKNIQEKLLEKINAPSQNDNETQVVQLWLDRENEKESYLLSGTPEEIMAQASMLKAISDLLDNVDIGTFIGKPLNDAVARKIDLGLELILDLRGRYEKPFVKNNSQRYQDKLERSMSIPFAKRPDFLELKKAFNLSNEGYKYQLWGDWTARAWVSAPNSFDKTLAGIAQVVARGISYDEAENNLERILQLSKGKVIDKSIKHDLGAEHKRYKVYPYRLAVVHKRINSFGKGRKTKSGRISSRKGILWVHQKEAPKNWDSVINDLTKLL